MCNCELNFDNATFSKQADYDEKSVRQAFSKAVPLKTLVIYCYDPRAVGIPKAVARELNQTYPGEIVYSPEGHKVASTTNIFDVVVAGGRANDAQRSITVAQHLFGIENIVVVHHTHCGATSFTADGIIEAFKEEQGNDISQLYPKSSVAISDYVESVKHDVKLLRDSNGTPKNVKILGYVYDIDTEALVKITESLPV